MSPEAAPLLKAAGVDAGYGTMQVLWGVDLDVRPGETVLLLGANGAGKTTFLKTLVGLIEARHGSIDLGGEDVTRMRSSDRMRLGMTYMSELAVFPDLSIEENIRVGAQALGHADPGARAEELYGVFPALREKRRAPASSLSGGQRKMLGIAKALAAEPRLLVMDEPSAGLSPLFVKEVIRILSDLRGRGLALLIAEQNIGFLEVATRVFVLEGGRIRFSGTVAEMTDNEALRRAYFGLK
jgi:branched-chain amino acid transport system ATP-binding protein